MRRAPPGMRLARSLEAGEWSRNSHRCLVLVLTFVAYASCKPTSIIKSVLDPDSHPLSSSSSSFPALPWPVGPLFLPSNHLGDPQPRGWAPFNSTAKLGKIDVAFLACYSVGMYAAFPVHVVRVCSAPS